MILNVIIEDTDPIEIHRHYEKLYHDSGGSLTSIQFKGNFRFVGDLVINFLSSKKRATFFRLRSTQEPD